MTITKNRFPANFGGHLEFLRKTQRKKIHTYTFMYKTLYFGINGKNILNIGRWSFLQNREYSLGCFVFAMQETISFSLAKQYSRFFGFF